MSAERVGKITARGSYLGYGSELEYSTEHCCLRDDAQHQVHKAIEDIDLLTSLLDMVSATRWAMKGFKTSTRSDHMRINSDGIIRIEIDSKIQLTSVRFP